MWTLNCSSSWALILAQQFMWIEKSHRNTIKKNVQWMWWWTQCSTLNDKLIIAFTIQISFGFWIFGVLLLLFVFCCLDIHTQCIKDILHLDGVILTFRLVWQLFRFCFQFIYWFLCFDNSVQKKNIAEINERKLLVPRIPNEKHIYVSNHPINRCAVLSLQFRDLLVFLFIY